MTDQSNDTPGNKIKVIQFDKDKRALVDSERPKITFADVGGLEAAKEEVRMNFILPLERPEIFSAFGQASGGSLLLYGPPGCGKTFFARAIAGEVHANFIHLELQATLSMWFGESETNLHDVFEKARNEKPCVIFIDELDAFGANRQNLKQHHERMLVNQLLIELDGLDSFNDGVYVIGATNTPWYLDPALRRAGRFNRLVFIHPPSSDERETILQLKLNGKPQSKLQLKTISAQTDFFSGADLEQLVNDAANQALKRSLESGEIQPITTGDLSEALKIRHPTTLDWFKTAKNWAAFSDSNGDYRPVLDYMRRRNLR